MRSTALLFYLPLFPLPIHFRCILDLQNMTDVSTILGIALIGVGAASAVYGAILCYTTKVGLKRCIFRIRNGSRLDVGGKLCLSAGEGRYVLDMC